jgi:hypothetical protein
MPKKKFEVDLKVDTSITEKKDQGVEEVLVSPNLNRGVWRYFSLVLKRALRRRRDPRLLVTWIGRGW